MRFPWTCYWFDLKNGTSYYGYRKQIVVRLDKKRILKRCKPKFLLCSCTLLQTHIRPLYNHMELGVFKEKNNTVSVLVVSQSEENRSSGWSQGKLHLWHGPPYNLSDLALRPDTRLFHRAPVNKCWNEDCHWNGEADKAQTNPKHSPGTLL